MLSLAMVLLLAFAGYSVDLGNWNLQRNEARSVAEAAALGGVAFLPDDFATARVTAEALAEAQGFDRSEVTVALGSAPNRLRVTVTREVENYFVRVIGMNTRTITETAEAEFEQPVDMGSPTIVLGNDPETGLDPGYWLSVAGQGVDKALGDQFANAELHGGTDGCSATTNTEWVTGRLPVHRSACPIRPSRCASRSSILHGSGRVALQHPDFPTPAEIAALVASSGSHPRIPAGYYDDAAHRATHRDPATSAPATTSPARRVRPPRSRSACPTVRPGTTPTTSPALSRCAPTTFPAYEPASIYAPPHRVDLRPVVPGPRRQRVAGAGQRHVHLRRGVPPLGHDLRAQPRPLAPDRATTSSRSRPTTARAEPLLASRAGAPRRRRRRRQRAGGLLPSAAADLRQHPRRGHDASSSSGSPPSPDRRLLRLSFFDIGDAAAPGTLTVLPPVDTGLGGFPDCRYTLGGAADRRRRTAPSPGVWDGNGYGGKTVEATVAVPPVDDPTNPYHCDVDRRERMLGDRADAVRRGHNRRHDLDRRAHRRLRAHRPRMTRTG